MTPFINASWSATVLSVVMAASALGSDGVSANLAGAWRDSLSKVVKLYGAGGLAGLEAYQTGLLVGESGIVLTPNTSVLEQGEVTVVLNDGRRFSGVVAGADPVSDLAVVTIDTGESALPCFDLEAAPPATPGQSVRVLANVFGIATGDEPVTVMHAVVAAIAPMQAERRPFESSAEPTVLLLDAVTSNPGSAGGAVVDTRGRLIGMLGRERRSRVTGAWLSYATPAADLTAPLQRVLQGQTTASAAGTPTPRIDLLERFGFTLTPDIVPRTPPYVDYVEPASPAAEAGLRVDDLLVSLGGVVTGSAAEARRVLATRRDQPMIELLVQRGDKLVDLTLEAAATPGADRGNAAPLRSRPR